MPAPRLLVAFLVVLLSWCTVQARVDPGVTLTKPPVLVVLLHSYDPSSDWASDVTDGVFTRLREAGVNADLREEFLDARRHEGAAYFGHVRDLLVTKYGATPPRLVITCDDTALGFLLDFPEVFTGVAVVFGGVQDDALAGRVPRARMTGVREEFHVDQIIATVQRAHPSATRVFVATSATANGATFRAQFATAAPKFPALTFVPLAASTMTFQAMVARLRSETTPRDVVIAAPIIRDVSGRSFDARLTMPTLVAASRAPVIGLAYDDRQQGLLAVTASTGAEHGRLMAAKGLKVLAGEAPAGIPVDVDTSTPLEFDARVLARFGIPEARLPTGTRVSFRPPPTFYQANRAAIWSATIFIGLQSAIIAGLVLNVARRRRAEKARDDQARALVAANRALEQSNRSLTREQDERLRAEEDLRHAQKMEAVGRLAGGVAHDFNNLLTVTLGYCELLRSRIRPESTEGEALDQIRKASEQAATLTHNLLAFSRKQVAAMTTIDVTRTIRGLEPMLRRFCGERVSLTLHLSDDAGCVELGAGQLEQVLMNLVINASDAMPDGGILEVVTRIDAVVDEGQAPTAPRQGRHVVITVTDTGSGMDAATRTRIFEPFFTTKEVGHGTGLGLSTVYAIVTQRGGRIAVESTVGRGTTFTVWLPAVACLDAAAESSPEVRPGSGARTVLVVEDEADLRALVVMLLRGEGYAVLEAGSGDEACLVAARHDGPIDLVLTDLVMPEQDGFTVARRLRDARPDLAVAYMSGYTAHLDVPDNQGSLILGKPFLPDALFAHVSRALDEGAGPR